MRQHSVSHHEDALSFNFNEETFRGVLQLKIIKLRNISFSNMEKATMSRPKKMPGKMLPGGGNNAKANEWNFCG